MAAKQCEEIDATGRVVMPGFVDCHAHLVWNTLPSGDEDSPGASTLAREPAIRALRNASAKRLESRARQYVDGMIRHGTTWLEARAGFGLDMRNEMKVLRVYAKLDGAPMNIVSTFSLPRSIHTARAENSGSYYSWICSELLPAIRLKTSASFASLSCGETALVAEQSRHYLQAARGLGFQIKIDAAAGRPGDAVRLALETGAISVDDLRDVSPVEIHSLARSSTVTVLLPVEAFYHLGTWSSARGLIDEGAAVALGTNFNPGVGPTFSVMATIALACTHLGMSAAEAICAATFNAACAIGVANKAGSLEVGKADLIVLNASDYREIASYLGVNLVHRTVKKGVTVYEEGAVVRRLPVTTEPASHYTDRS